jgi:hypothetical protein
MYLQTVMLLLRAEGLHSCPQMAWSQVRETVAEVLSPLDRLILFCGMSVGYEDPVSYVRTGRAALNETVTFVGDSEIGLRAAQLDQTNHLHLSQNEGTVGLTKYDAQA